MSTICGTTLEVCDTYTDTFYELDSSVKGWLEFYRTHGPFSSPKKATEETAPTPKDRRSYTWFIYV